MSLEIIQFHNIIFKNKSSSANLQAHEEDFDIPAEWHFHRTVHGKGACDGIGANINRFAARSSLQRSSKHHILTPQALFQWAKNNCKETLIFLQQQRKLHYSYRDSERTI